MKNICQQNYMILMEWTGFEKMHFVFNFSNTQSELHFTFNIDATSKNDINAPRRSEVTHTEYNYK